jgi:GTPase SAR1 family protein
VTSFHYIQNIREQIVASRDISDTPIIVVANKSDLAKDKSDMNLEREQSRSKHEIVSTVRKTWRASYVECSAKHNWNITAMFKEVAPEMNSHKDNVNREMEEEQQKCCRMFS